MKGFFSSSNYFDKTTGLFTTVKSHPLYEQKIEPLLLQMISFKFDEDGIEKLIEYLLIFDSVMDKNKERTNEFGLRSLKKTSDVRPYQELYSVFLQSCSKKDQQIIFGMFK